MGVPEGGVKPRAILAGIDQPQSFPSATANVGFSRNPPIAEEETEGQQGAHHGNWGRRVQFFELAIPEDRPERFKVGYPCARQ